MTDTTICMDCGALTLAGPGSTRCPECWTKACHGGHPQFELLPDGDYDVVEVREAEGE